MNYAVRFLADEDFDNSIVRAVLRRLPHLDIVRVQDEGLSGLHDTEVLEWAAQEGRVLLTHDISTMKEYAYGRVSKGLSMPGVFIASQRIPIAEAIETIALIAECSISGEWEGQVRRLPLS